MPYKPTGQPPGRPRLERGPQRILQSRIPEPLDRSLSREARRSGRTRREIIVAALEAALKERESK